MPEFTIIATSKLIRDVASSCALLRRTGSPACRAKLQRGSGGL